MTSLDVIALTDKFINQSILDTLYIRQLRGSKTMAIEKIKKLAKRASVKESKILQALEGYCKGDCSLGYTASKLKIPLRALMEFMAKQGLPYYGDEEDGKRGLKRIAQIRSNL
jgi:predicted HTH domain antitoxin